MKNLHNSTFWVQIKIKNMKRTKLLLVFALILSTNLVFSQSKFSLAVGTKYYTNGNYAKYYYSRQYGFSAAIFYDLTPKKSIGLKVERSFVRDWKPQYYKFFEVGSLIFHFNLVKQKRFESHIETALAVRHFYAFKQFLGNAGGSYNHYSAFYAPSFITNLAIGFPIDEHFTFLIEGEAHLFKVKSNGDDDTDMQLALNALIKYHF